MKNNVVNYSQRKNLINGHNWTIWLKVYWKHSGWKSYENDFSNYLLKIKQIKLV